MKLICNNKTKFTVNFNIKILSKIAFQEKLKILPSRSPFFLNFIFVHRSTESTTIIIYCLCSKRRNQFGCQRKNVTVFSQSIFSE